MGNLLQTAPCSPGGCSCPEQVVDVIKTVMGTASYPLSSNVDFAHPVQVFRNGQLQEEGGAGNGYVVIGNTINITPIVYPDELLVVYYVAQ